MERNSPPRMLSREKTQGTMASIGEEDDLVPILGTKYLAERNSIDTLLERFSSKSEDIFEGSRMEYQSEIEQKVNSGLVFSDFVRD